MPWYGVIYCIEGFRQIHKNTDYMFSIFGQDVIISSQICIIARSVEWLGIKSYVIIE